MLSIGKVYVINLDHRTDRMEGFMESMKEVGLDSIVERVSAIYDPEFGVLGCTKSCIKVLELIIESDDAHSLLCEDDVRFRDPIKTRQFLSWFDTHNDIKYDIISLSGNNLVPDFRVEPTEYPELNRVKCLQALSCWIISKQFAKTILEKFTECKQNLEQTRNRRLYSPDQYLKRYQQEWQWFLSNPILAYQVESYSDLENKVVNYGC
jgi:GR25 family glycosyltransferase involved in LPS biosynthesis